MRILVAQEDAEMSILPIALRHIAERATLILGLISGALPHATCAQQQPRPTVLLTFDVEEPGDAALLEALNIDVPATYFFTGDYGGQFPDLVRGLAKAGNSIGSHSHFHDDLTTLTPRHLALDLILSRMTLEAITCQPVTWFRAPYLAYNDRVMRGVANAGYLADSSDKLPWPVNAILPELAITVHDGRLVSDIDALEPMDGSAPPGLPFLIAAFDYQRQRGLPFVVLMHPRVIGPRPDVLHGLIDHARAAGAQFLTADAFMQQAQTGGPRNSLRLPRQPQAAEVAAVRRAVIQNGITDLILPSAPTSALGSDAAAQSDSELSTAPPRLPAHLAALRDHGVRLHLELDMREEKPAALLDQVTVRSIAARAANLARDPSVDGLVLVGLGQSSVRDGLTEDTLDQFGADTGLVGLTINTVMHTAYLKWVYWRADRLTTLVNGAAGAARGATDRRISIAVAVSADLLLDFAEIEIAALDLPELAHLLDAVILEVPRDAALQPQLLRRLRLAATVQTGDTDVFVQRAEPVAIGPEFPAASLFHAGDRAAGSDETAREIRQPCNSFEGHWSFD
ncbi:polysaccharide deacetylase family protein [Thalassorhabdomicrobium marinisediminis]|uniref:Chitooligosaccharide deacetylase n=1 Tax=Thalassorhabdomicrobium marinisediminis TaxID=2170577 RepID=A0A2T7FT51_9RHOB|nr:polysaccharide deacetylase family protein [Thalassorhabdomicrobium marinisediminis]PVA05335.1 hypothetical protein DC363_16105 [Thalassorhabdomicrobium marinisediminis]